MPTDVTTANLNAPIFIDGTTVGANYIYPYFQGTSTTANGYLANSTSSFNPALASFLYISSGTDGWYPINYEIVGTVFSGGTEYMRLISDGTMVSNANATVQMIPFYTVDTDPGGIYADGAFFQTYNLVANQATTFNSDTRYDVSANTDGSGIIMRNITGNTRVTVVYNENEILKGKI
jgi:hypothetical protein